MKGKEWKVGTVTSALSHCFESGSAFNPYSIGFLLPLRVHGPHRRLLRGAALQDHEGQGVEGEKQRNTRVPIPAATGSTDVANRHTQLYK
jgi:hypothetical protein